MTGDHLLNLYAAKVLGLQHLDTHFAATLRGLVKQSQADLWGSGGVLGGTKAAMTYASSVLTLSATVSGWTGDGYRLTLDHTDASWSTVPFANSGATLYYIGARWASRPAPSSGPAGAGPELGTDGQPGFGALEDVIGERGAPTSVTDLGGSLKVVVDGLVGAGWTVGSTRPVTVWLVDPVTSSSEAVYEGTVSWDGTNHVVTVPHTFGQDTPSTTAGDYLAVVHGPTVTTTNLSTDPAYLFIGTCQSGTFSNTNQVLIDALGDLWSYFGVEHDAGTGEHTDVTADSVTVHSSGTDRVELGTGGGSNNGAVIFSDVAGNPGLIDVRRASGDPLLEVRNLAGGNTAILGFEERLRALDGNDPRIEADSGSLRTLELENVGAGHLDVSLFGTGKYRYNTAKTSYLYVPSFSDIVKATTGGPASIVPTGSPPHSTVTAWVCLIPLTHLLLDAGGRELTIASWGLLNERTNAGDAITGQLYRTAGGGTAARVAVGGALSVSGTTSGYAMDLITPAHAAVAANYYWLELTFTAGAAGSIKWATLELIVNPEALI